MLNTELYVIFTLQTFVILFTFYVIFKDSGIRKREKNSETSAEMQRGDRSMKMIHGMYLLTVTPIFFLINNVSNIDGYKVILFIINFGCFTYIFYFSDWFRNYVFFPLIKKVSTF